MFNGENATVIIKRGGYVDGKSIEPTEVARYKGYITPDGVDSQFFDPETVGDVYRFSTEYYADIHKSDKIEVIADVLADAEGDYNVMGVFHKRSCSLSYTRVYLAKHNL